MRQQNRIISYGGISKSENLKFSEETRAYNPATWQAHKAERSFASLRMTILMELAGCGKDP